MGKLISIWSSICRRKCLTTVAAFAVVIGFLDGDSLARRFGYEREVNQLKEEMEKYRADYGENAKRLNETSINPGAVEQIAREKYLMREPSEDIYVFEDQRMRQLAPVLFAVDTVMTLIGAAVFIIRWIYAPYIYTVRAGCIALTQVNTPVRGKSKTLKRLRVQQIFGALALILTGAFMSTTRDNEWITCLTVAAILEFYTAFRTPQEEEKERS